MEFQCVKCDNVFIPHTFIGMRHPSQARCPDCGAKGKLTERGKEGRKSRFHEMNKATYGPWSE